MPQPLQDQTPIPSTLSGQHTLVQPSLTALRGGRAGQCLAVQLPAVIDGVNARMLRKLVLRRLPECAALRLDADALVRLGRMGAACLWQIMTVARLHGVEVEMINVSEGVQDALDAVRDVEGIAEHSGDTELAARPSLKLVECEAELRISGKTLRMAAADTAATAQIPAATRQTAAPAAKRAGSWTDRVMRLLPLRKRRAA
jgi:anti-anti-sigma regulatory factor